MNDEKPNKIFKQDESDLYPLKGHLKCKVHHLSLTGGKNKVDMECITFTYVD